MLTMPSTISSCGKCALHGRNASPIAKAPKPTSSRRRSPQRLTSSPTKPPCMSTISTPLYVKMYPFCMAVQPKVCCVKSTKTVSMAVKAPVKRRFTVTNRATTGWRSTCRHPASSTSVPWAAGEAGARVVPIQRVSGRKRSTSSALASATSMATQKGTAVPRGASAPPSAGPTTKPNPIAAPMSPIPLARPSAGVTSATTACAEPIFEAPRPPMKRATNRIGSEPASAESAKESASMSRAAKMIGRRP